MHNKLVASNYQCNELVSEKERGKKLKLQKANSEFIDTFFGKNLSVMSCGEFCGEF